MPTHTVRLPAPESDKERNAARTLGHYLNPARAFDPDRPEATVPNMDPDSPALAALIELSRALWLGEPVEVVVPLDDRAVTAFLEDFTEPSSATLPEGGINAAITDLYYAAGAAVKGITRDRFRAFCLVENALWDVWHRANPYPENDCPLRDTFSIALGVGVEQHTSWGTVEEQREKFRAAVAAAERAMDIAEGVERNPEGGE